MAPGCGFYRSTPITIPPIAVDLATKIRREQPISRLSPMEHWVGRVLQGCHTAMPIFTGVRMATFGGSKGARDAGTSKASS